MKTNKRKELKNYYEGWGVRESMHDFLFDWLQEKYKKEYKALCNKSRISLYAMARKAGIRDKFEKIEVRWRPDIVFKENLLTK